ncbi:MAG: TolC family protein [Candidatus Tectomicrobia bacterium]|uniref:TolC family protein n=1 Tax=Tectimicrobiota bacterium TaxID=2528274 RepID=A0A937W2D0_UNCTE|nr:TolC family protein [Candidatus Tectomicrobia bacterium]
MMPGVSADAQPVWPWLGAVVGLLLGSLTAPAYAEELTIADALRLAMQQNPTLQAQQATVDAAAGERRQARVFPHNPRLEIDGVAGAERETTRQSTRTLTVKLSQEIPLGGKWHQRTAVANAGVERAQWEAHNAARELLREVQETFYRLVFLDEKQRLVEQASTLAQQGVRLAEERYRAGESAQLDVNLARVEVQQAQRQRLEVLSQLTQARATLNRFLARPPATPLTVRGTLDAPLPTMDATTLQQQALQQRPDVRSRQAAQDAARSEIALAQAQRVPDVEIGLVFEREDSGGTTRQTVGGESGHPLAALEQEHRGDCRGPGAPPGDSPGTHRPGAGYQC